MARKRFGQHFLRDPAVIERMLRAIRAQPGQQLVEIGPGRGALTQPLLELCGTLDAVEIDRDLAAWLQERFASFGGFHLHTADALHFDFHQLQRGETALRLVGNLPYNISTPLLFHLLDQSDCILDLHLMLQREVAARLAASPGTGAYGRLTVMTRYRCATDVLFDVRPEAFNPPPKVESSVIRLIPHPSPPVQLDSEQTLFQVVTQAFSKRRKTLRNALGGLLDEAHIRSVGVDPGQRPETLSLEEFAVLANLAHRTGVIDN